MWKCLRGIPTTGDYFNVVVHFKNVEQIEHRSTYSESTKGQFCGGRLGGLKLPPPEPFAPASRPLPKGFPPLLFYVYCKMLYNIVKFFSFSPGFRHLGNSASPLSPPASRIPPAPYSPGRPRMSDPH